MPIINSHIFKKKHNININKSLSIKEIAKLSKMPEQALIEVFNKGVGAYHTHPASVRPMVKSPEQWGFARIYSFVMKRRGTFYGVDRHIKDKYKI
jgi:hypothetical protein